ncbi:Tripeptidyl-peptidase-like protein [Hapsidospora chrysogenum ATCC 11550]|uniref:tripeptidyl-peptidase II n=1 Tax=Hapsidospora chrysogenum (strain ATCC 11550 / CBS 779.69 / DSM 880 / IAM 14645 / JCM 23072 / IMI 49137) TaxID=857340 RepID=A0A086T1A6_HAPC1|nr:Tripeptidyl-peptidase-like protein [Hapsidospora chrysogenum ATCC 11550]
MPHIPDGWSLVERDISPEQPLRLSIALREPHMHELRSKITGPSATRLSRQAAQALREPDQEDVDAVQRWLSENGITNTSQEDDWIHVHTTVGAAQALLEMKMHRYRYSHDKGSVLRTREYSVPGHLVDAVSFIHPIANFLAPKKDLTRISAPNKLKQRDDDNGPPCKDYTTPQCVRELYNFPPVLPNATSSIRLGIAGFLEQNANYLDVDLFLRRLAPEIAATGYNFSVELVNGGQNSQHPAQSGHEAALDMDYAMALGYPSKITYYSTGGRGVKLGPDGEPLTEEEFVDNEPYLEFLEYLLAKPDEKTPHVLSFSYADDELSVPRPYAERVCSMFGLLTGRGTSVLVASGDGGAAGSSNSACRTHDGMDVTMAVFPATCPWVTAVGGVVGQSDPPEGATFSGGGFSQYFPREPWQDGGVVDSYVQALGDHLDGYYNASMRAIPDISAIAKLFQTIIAQQSTMLDGTSASTPVLASMIALINEERVRAGKGVLGWLNEKLYSREVRAVLQDVTGGASKSCVFADGVKPGGWPAKKGWDAMTGLGVPADFVRFRDVLVEMP